MPPPSSLVSSSFHLNSASPATMIGYALGALSSKPEWLDSLLSEKFFTPCAKHVSSKKNERNIYCLDCSLGICQYCLSNHNSHRLLQIRRYVYHDVIRLQDIQKLVDCAQVQTYIINSAKVVFLNQRPQPRPSKGLGNVCQTCERSLQDAYQYCSVACKVDAVMAQGKDLQNLLPRGNSLHIPASLNCSPSESLKGCELENEEQLSPNSVLLEVTSSPTSSGSTANDTGSRWGCKIHNKAGGGARSCHNLNISDASDEEDNEMEGEGQGKDLGFLIPIRTLTAGKRFPAKRRKGTPHRSPFC